MKTKSKCRHIIFASRTLLNSGNKSPKYLVFCFPESFAIRCWHPNRFGFRKIPVRIEGASEWLRGFHERPPYLPAHKALSLWRCDRVEGLSIVCPLPKSPSRTDWWDDKKRAANRFDLQPLRALVCLGNERDEIQKCLPVYCSSAFISVALSIKRPAPSALWTLVSHSYPPFSIASRVGR